MEGIDIRLLSPILGTPQIIVPCGFSIQVRTQVVLTADNVSQ